MSITPSKQTSVYRQVDAILKTEDIYCGDKYFLATMCIVKLHQQWLCTERVTKTTFDQWQWLLGWA